MMQKTDRILVTGNRGMVGRHVVERLLSLGYENVVGSKLVNFTSHSDTIDMFKWLRPVYVFHAAAFVRGLGGNLRSGAYSFLRNTTINLNVIEGCREAGVKKIAAMGTVAMYPQREDNSYHEDGLWLGEPHDAEYGYGHAKRHMLAQLQAYKKDHGMEYACAISTNLYGPYDRFNIESGHVISSLVRKFVEAKRAGRPIKVWGDGSATRDFLHAQDAARALVMMMDLADGPMNLATGTSHTIREAVDILSACAQYDRVEWDTSKPVGQRLRQYDVSRLRRMGFAPEYTLARGLAETYDWFVDNEPRARK